MKKVQKVLEKIVNFVMVLVVIAIIFCIYNIVAVKLFGKSYVNIFGYSFFEVATGSMSGAIEPGDAVVVKINADYQVGDVVTYASGDDFITHRIIAMNGDKIITKGDANNTNDSPITSSVILGKVIKVLPNISTWKKVLLTPKVIILVFVTLISFSILFSYNGSAIKISMSDQKDGYSKRRNRESKKMLEATQIINIKDLQKEREEVKNNVDVSNMRSREKRKANKKVLDATQIIDISKLKKNNESLEKTDVLDLDDFDKYRGDRNEKI